MKPKNPKTGWCVQFSDRRVSGPLWQVSIATPILGYALALLVASLFIASPAVATNHATAFSHGPTMPVWAVGFDSTGAATTGMFNAGAGYSLNWNLFPTWDGGYRRLTIGLPIYVAIPETSSFAYRVGLTIGTLNNMLSFGAVLDMVRTDGNGGPGTGALLGDISKENLSFVFSFGLNMGTGGTPTPVAGKATTVETSHGNAPGYVGW